MVNSANTELRKLPYPGAEITGYLAYGEIAAVIEEKNDWIRISHGKQEGWVNSKKIVFLNTLAEQDKGFVNAGEVRKGPGWRFPVQPIKRGEKGAVVQSFENWVLVKVGANDYGWVEKSQLTKEYVSNLTGAEGDDPTQRAKSFEDRGFKEKAILEYRQAVKENPQNRTALKALIARLSVRKEDWAEAVALSMSYLKINPDDLDIRSNLANLLIYTGRISEARGELEVICGTSPGRTEDKLSFARVLSWQGDYKRSFSLFKEIATEKPLQIKNDALVDYAHVLLMNGKPAEAKPVLEGYLKSDPAGSGALLELAKVEYALGHEKNALEIYRKAGKKEDDLVSFYLEMARLFYGQNKLEESVALYEKVLAVKPADKIVSEYIGVLSSDKRFLDKTIAITGKLVEENPENPEYQFRFAELLSYVPARRGESLKWYDKLLDSGDQHVPERMKKTVLWMEPEPSLIPFYKKLLIYYPADTDLSEGLADALVKAGENPGNVIDLYTEILTKNPRRIETRRKLANIYKVQGREQEALKEFETILQTDPEDMWSLLGAGGIYISSGNSSTAYPLFKRLLEKEPDNISALEGYAGAAWSLGEKKEALRAYEKVHAISGKTAFQDQIQKLKSEMMLEEGKKALAENDFEKARRIYEDALILSPGNQDALFGKATVYYSTAKYDEALLILNKLDSIPASDLKGAIYGMKGEIAKQEEKFDDAVENYRLSYTHSANKVYPLLGLGGVNLKSGNYQDAINTFQEVLRIDSLNTDALLGQASSLRGLRRNKEAMEIYEKIASLKPDPDLSKAIKETEMEIVLQEGDDRLKEGKTKEAFIAYLKAHLLEPSNPYPLVALGGIYLNNGQTTEAKEVCQMALLRNQTSLDAQFGIVRCLIKEGDYKSAAAHIDKIRRTDHTPGAATEITKLQSSCMASQAEALKKEGKIEEAFYQYRKAFQLDPDNPDLLNGIAGIYLQNQQYSDAEELWTKVVKIDPENVGGILGLASAMEAQDKTPEAITMLTRFYETHQDAKTGWELVRMLQNSGKNREANSIVKNFIPDLETDGEYTSPDHEQFPPVSVMEKESAIADFIAREMPPPASLGAASWYDPVLPLLRGQEKDIPFLSGSEQDKIILTPLKTKGKENWKTKLKHQIQLANSPFLTIDPVRYRHKSGETGTSELNELQTGMALNFPFICSSLLSFQVNTAFLETGNLRKKGIEGGMEISNFSPLSFLRLSGGIGAISKAFEVKDRFAGHFKTTFELREVHLSGNLFQRPVRESFLSSVGVKDAKGRLYGGVTEKGSEIEVGINRKSYDGKIIVGNSTFEGVNVAENDKRGIYLSFGHTFLPKGLKFLRLGYNFRYFEFDRNMGGFSFGEGAYFSPESCLFNTLGVDLEGEEGKWVYHVNGQLGIQSLEGERTHYFSPGMRWGGNLNVTTEYSITENFFFGIGYSFDNAGTTYNEHRAGISFKYFFKPNSN
ncbi:MAG: tetratricopeptide repeat protein [Mangrovibacterium sp.]